MRRKLIWGLSLLIWSANASAQTECTADLNGDFVVDLDDLLAMLIHYGDSCENDMEVYPTLFVSEIHYNPNSEQGNDSDWEFIEIFNPHAFTVSLSGWSVQNAIIASFDEGAFILPGGWYVVARNVDTLLTVMNNSEFISSWNSGQSLNNTGETIEIVAPDGTISSFVPYEDNDGWSPEPDGLGPSLEWMDPGLPNAEPASWSASLNFGGTPGEANSMWGLSDPE